MPLKPDTKDSIKSTWPKSDRGDWTHNHWLIHFLNAYPVSLDKEVPKHAKTDPIPYLPQLAQHVWVLVYAFIPLLLHQLWLNFTYRESLNKYAVFGFYFMAFNSVIVHEINILRRVGDRYGFLDGDEHERDGVPDVGVSRVTSSLYKTTGSRMAVAVYLSYNPEISPAQKMSDPSWWMWLVLEIGLYCVVLDFWFYWYHRSMHEVSFLWKYHRTHHLAKHPNTLLSAYGSHEQEFFDMVGVPLLTYLSLWAMGVSLGFYEWWICHQYVAFTEVLGHAGIRLHLTPPTTFSFLLQFLGMELVIEDHDLHHRKGWRKSHNYGKQTRVWDRLFGTCGERIEMKGPNTDYDNVADLPLI
jgi:sterol desaturase/sphingolipid hydroxylase (fatty acid hydroxylase superfamily)